MLGSSGCPATAPGRSAVQASPVSPRHSGVYRWTVVVMLALALLAAVFLGQRRAVAPTGPPVNVEANGMCFLMEDDGTETCGVQGEEQPSEMLRLFARGSQ